jgi:hypothetical protein
MILAKTHASCADLPPNLPANTVEAARIWQLGAIILKKTARLPDFASLFRSKCGLAVR